MSLKLKCDHLHLDTRKWHVFIYMFISLWLKKIIIKKLPSLLVTPASIFPVVTERCCIWKSVLFTVQAVLMENGWLCSHCLCVWCNSLHACGQLCSQSRAVGWQQSRVKPKPQFDLVPLARWGKVRREGAAVRERDGLSYDKASAFLSCVSHILFSCPAAHHPATGQEYINCKELEQLLQLLLMCVWS